MPNSRAVCANRSSMYCRLWASFSGSTGPRWSTQKHSTPILSRHCLLHVAENQQPPPGFHHLLETCGLRQHRLPVGQVMGCPITEPTRPSLDVSTLGDADLPTRSHDVVLITSQIPDLPGVG